MPEPPKLSLSPAQVAAAVLVTLTTALLSSYAGALGTVIGACAMSVVSTLGYALYPYWLRRAGYHARSLRGVHRRAITLSVRPLALAGAALVLASAGVGAAVMVSGAEAAAGSPAANVLAPAIPQPSAPASAPPSQSPSREPSSPPAAPALSPSPSASVSVPPSPLPSAPASATPPPALPTSSPSPSSPPSSSPSPSPVPTG